MLESEKIREEIIINGITIKETLKETFKANEGVIDKNTDKQVSNTKIIFNYCNYYNVNVIKNCESKKDYLKAMIDLKWELDSFGFEIGSQWIEEFGKEIKFPMKKGNMKLEPTTLILNIGCASFCASKNCGLCPICHGCYALASERQYIGSLIYRITQTIRFQIMDSETIAKQILRKKKVRFVRFNESGDLYDLDDLKKIKEIAKIIFEAKGIYTYLYTHRLDLKPKKEQTEYLKINLSDIDFIASDEFTDNLNGFICCGTCRDCIFCKFECGKPINCLKHGDLKGYDHRTMSKIYFDEFERKIYYNAWFLNHSNYNYLSEGFATVGGLL